MSLKSFEMYQGKMAGKNRYAHKWFMSLPHILKEGQTVGILCDCGLALFEYKGVKKNGAEIEEVYIDEMNKAGGE